MTEQDALIERFISTHEILISQESRDTDKPSKFTIYGNLAGYRAVQEVVDMLDYDTKEKVLDMIKNRDVNIKYESRQNLFKV